MALPSKGLKAYKCDPKIQLKKLSAFLEEAKAAIIKAKIQIMDANTSPLDLNENVFKPQTDTDSQYFVRLNEEFGARYEYLIGLIYVPNNVASGVFEDSNDEWIFFNEYKPFAADLLRKMPVAAPRDVKTQTGIGIDNLEQYCLASILFPVKGLKEWEKVKNKNALTDR